MTVGVRMFVVIVALGSLCFFPAQVAAQQAFYTFTSAPGGDGFVWDFDQPPSGLNDLPLDETFFAPTDDGSGDINIENFSGNTTFFDSNYQAAGNSSLISGDAWWGNPDDSVCCGVVGASFINTTIGAADSVAFDFAWALAGQDADSFLDIEVFDEEFDSAFLSFDLDNSFNAGPVFGGFEGWEGSIFFDLNDAQLDNPDVDQIASFSVDVSSVATFGGTGEFAIDNLSIDGGGGGGPSQSDVFPFSSFGGFPIVGTITTNRLKGSFDTNVVFDVKNDGTGNTTFSATLDGTSDPQFAVASPATNEPIAAGGVESTGIVATLSSNLPSGLYESSVTITNDLNGSDPSETVGYDVTIYDPPDLTDDSGATVQAHVDPVITIANAAAGPHAGAARAGVEVTGTTTTGPFTVSGLAFDDFIGPGQTGNGHVNFNRFGRLTATYVGTHTVDLQMNSAPGSFLNGRTPVPAVQWDLSFNLVDTDNDSTTVAASESYDDQVGVNKLTTAATLIDGNSPTGQTIDMQISINPEQGGTPTADLATDVVDLDFGALPGLYVLQFTYLDANIPAGATENDLRLLFYDTTNTEWSAAIDANSDGGSGSAFFSGSYESFLASLGGGTLDGADLSAFGVDTANDHVWAVLDHASLFAVGVLAAPTNLPGDFNGDGTVNAADYTLWRDNLGAGDESALNGNGDGQGGVDQADFNLWRNNFGVTAPGSATSRAVPEPTGVALFVVSMLFFLPRRGRHA